MGDHQEEGRDRRVLGNTPMDQVVGRLIERTELLVNESAQSRKVLASLDRTLIKFEATIEQIDRRMTTIENQPDVTNRITAIELRLKPIEDVIGEWKDLRKTVIKYGLMLGAIALLSGTAGGTLLQHIFDWH